MLLEKCIIAHSPSGHVIAQTLCIQAVHHDVILTVHSVIHWHLYLLFLQSAPKSTVRIKILDLTFIIC